MSGVAIPSNQGKVQANWRNDFVNQAGSGYHSLNGVFSKGETRGEFECTSTIPVPD